MRNWDFGDYFFFGLITFMLSLVVLFFVAAFADVKENRRLVAQCMADGKKEYECVALLKDPPSHVMPVVVPIHTGR